MKLRAAITVAAMIAISAAVFAQRRDGKWDVTMEMDMPGMPVKMQPITTTHCVTKEQASDPQKMIPQGRGGSNPDCKYTDQKIDGTKVSWSMKCEGEQPMTGTGEMTYGENAYTGTVKMDISGRGTMTMKYTGKRVGDCDGK